jgi:hypothetical protein
MCAKLLASFCWLNVSIQNPPQKQHGVPIDMQAEACPSQAILFI